MHMTCWCALSLHSGELFYFSLFLFPFYFFFFSFSFFFFFPVSPLFYFIFLKFSLGCTWKNFFFFFSKFSQVMKNSIKKRHIRNYWEDQLGLYQTKKREQDREALSNILRAVAAELAKPGMPLLRSHHCGAQIIWTFSLFHWKPLPRSHRGTQIIRAFSLFHWKPLPRFHCDAQIFRAFSLFHWKLTFF